MRISGSGLYFNVCNNLVKSLLSLSVTVCHVFMSVVVSSLQLICLFVIILFIRVGCIAHRELDSLFQPIPLVPFNLVHSRVCLCVFFLVLINKRKQIERENFKEYTSSAVPVLMWYVNLTDIVSVMLRFLMLSASVSGLV